MAGENLALYVATYGDASAASADYERLKAAENGTDLVVEGAIVLARDDEGEVTVAEIGGVQAAGGAYVGGAVGLVMGLFAPPLLLSTAIGAGIGAAIGELVKKHEEKEIGVEVEEYLPKGASAIVVLLDDTYVDRADQALAEADRKISRDIDSGDYAVLQKAIAEAETGTEP